MIPATPSGQPATRLDSHQPNPAGPRNEAAVLRSVELTGPAGRLEAVLNPGSPNAPFAALICHPHPRYGGNLHNKVVYHAMKAFNDPESVGRCCASIFAVRGSARASMTARPKPAM